jgi:hypothetical protein
MDAGRRGQEFDESQWQKFKARKKKVSRVCYPVEEQIQFPPIWTHKVHEHQSLSNRECKLPQLSNQENWDKTIHEFHRSR